MVESTQLEGLQFDDYILKKKLGSGGFADVYLAENASGQNFAVKIARGDTHSFKVELNSQKLKLKHKNIVEVLGIGRRGAIREHDMTTGYR